MTIRNYSKHYLLLGISAFYLFPLTAYAQDSGVDVVTTTSTRSNQSAFEQIGNQGSVSGTDIEFLGATHINEVLLRVPGANIHRNDGQESLTSIRSPIFTGAGACGEFLTAQDGIPLRAAGFCNVNELFESFSEQAGRVEVVRGPGSVLYGTNALHGVVNVLSKEVGDGGVSASMEGGSWGYLKFNGTGAIKDGDHGIRVSATVIHDGGYRDESGFDQQKGMLRHEYDNGDWKISNNIMVTNLDQDTAGFIQGFEVYKDRAIAKSNPGTDAYRKATSFRYWSTISKNVTDNVRWQFSPYARYLDMEFLMHFLPGDPTEMNDQHSFGFQNAFYINEGSDLEIIAGFDGEYAKGSLMQFQEGPTPGFLATKIIPGGQYDFDVTSTMGAAFIRGEFDVSSQFTLLGGTRLEYMKYDYDNNLPNGRVDGTGLPCPNGCRYTRPADREDSFTNVSFELGGLFNIDENNNFYGKYSRSFRAPQANELYRLQETQTVANIDSVKLDSLEAGLRGQYETLDYDVTVFAMKKDNYIFQNSNRINVDNGKSKHYGVEAAFEYRFPMDVSVRFSGTYASHKYDFDLISNNINLNGNYIDTAPKHFGSVQLNWAPADKVRAQVEWIHMGSYYIGELNLNEYEGHDYLNLRVEVEATENINVFLRVTNLTNTRYAERADFAFGNERYFPGKPRGFFGGARVNF